VIENSFSKLATEYCGVKSPMWTEGHTHQWKRNMDVYATPIIGERAITEIEPMDIVQIMRSVEAQGTYETRDRLLQSISATFKYAMATGRCKSNPADIRIALAERPKVEHFACISTDELPLFLRAVTAYERMAKVSPIAIGALRLLMLTAVRTAEVRFSKWADFDLDAGEWIIPEEQTGRKGRQGKRKSHAVPLSTQAIAVLRNLYPYTGNGDYVFQNRNSVDRVISENTVLKIIDTLGYKGKMTGHGFRSLARTTLGDMGYRREVLEVMLAHGLEDATEAAYARSNYFKERQGIMQAWADHLDAIEAGASVTPIHAGVAA
jgi:integrase